MILAEGYEKNDIIGKYEFINHRTASDGAKVKTAQNISLNEDGTISGDILGIWLEKEGTYYAVFEINDITYKGVFFRQHNEKGKMVMTFSAIGSNNETIWGVKNIVEN